MSKIKLQISVVVCTLFSISSFAQNNFTILIKGVDKDSSWIVEKTGIRTSFPNQAAARDYISKLPAYLNEKGFVTASIDSLHFDSTHAHLVLYTGSQYRWAQLKVDSTDKTLLDAVGWRDRNFAASPIDFNQVKSWQDKILNYLENNGYPFAKISLDELNIDSTEMVVAKLKINKGPLYKIDSMRIYGTAKISNNFLQRYLDFPNGSLYNKEKLLNINKKIRELTYVEEERPSNLTLLGTGSILNVYLKNRKSSQVNVILGFLPNNDQLASRKMLVTGDVNLLLKNNFGGGETIGLIYQRLQVESERGNILFNFPYILRSPFGFDFNFDFFRKDSSFINVNIQIGTSYILNRNESGKLFIQRNSTIVNEGGVNGPFIIVNRRLPDIADVRSTSIGLDYDYNKTDYRLNPRKGTEINIISSFGSKEVRKNNTIISLKDPGDPNFKFESLYDTVRLKTFQLRIRGSAAKYFPLGKQRSTLKTALNGGTFQSGSIYRNELFQIGGYRLLRGFDEQSQYLSSYLIGTVEYRYLVDQNSFFYVLADGGWGQDNRLRQKIDYSYFGTGVGLAFESKAGIFNLAWAIGKRNDGPLNLRQSKIHFGFINYF